MTTLPQLIANAVETNPDGVALVLADGTGPLEQVGYADLDAWSSRLARALIARGIGPEDLVAVAIPRSLDAVLAVWAVAKTGAGFVPIDPAYPPEWVAHLLADAGVGYGLAVSWVRNELPVEIEWLQVDTVETARALEQFSADAVTYADRVRPLRAEHPAYVTYDADGETVPDGIMVTQAGLSGLCAEQQGRYRVEPEDRTLNFAPMPADSAVLELLLALGGAATMVVVSPLVTRADEVAALLQRTGVTHAYLPPDALRLIDPTGLDELGVVVTGRRPCPPELVQRWAIPVTGGSMRALYQGYGPAETTVMTNISSPLTPGGPLTLGAPIRGVTAHILDERLAPVPDGEVGELYLGGPQLARGYHRRPGRTAQLLVADPFADDGSRLYRTGDLVRRGPGGDMEYIGRVTVPALDDSVAVPRRGRAEVAESRAGSAQETAAAGDRWPVGEQPDYEQSLPIRDTAQEGGDGAGPGHGYGVSDPYGSEPGRSDAAEPVVPETGRVGAAEPPASDFGRDDVHQQFSRNPRPEPDSRLASEKRDLDLPGRGYLEMPDRQHALPGRGGRSAANPIEPQVADIGDPAAHSPSGTAAPGVTGPAGRDASGLGVSGGSASDSPETAGSRAGERTFGGTPEPTVSGGSGFDLAGAAGRGTADTAARSPQPMSADDWLSRGRQLPGPGDAAPLRTASGPIAGDATAFYDPQAAADDRERSAEPGSALAGSLPGRPDWPAPAPPVGPQLPGRTGFGAASSPATPGTGDDEHVPAAPPPPVERPETIPLSPGQLRLWQRNQTAPETATETITAAMSLTGTLDAAAMQAAVADVVDRHETLRTVYPATDGVPHQVVLPREQAVPEVVAEPIPAAELAGWLQALSQTDFDAADAEQVPVRFALAELSPREHVVAVVVHRILADEVSAGLLLRDLLRAFLGRRNRSRPLWQPLSVQYLDYFLSRRAQLGDLTDPDSLAARRLAFWRDYLAGLPPRIDFAAAAGRPDGTGQRVHAFDIGTRTHRRIADIAQRAGTSEFIVLRAAFAVLLARTAAATDIVLGSSVRGNDERELDDAIGPYANTVVLRTRIDPAESFLDLVARVAESDRRAFANADLPFETLTAALAVEDSLFDVAISLRHNDIPRLEMPSLATEPVEVAGAPADAVLRLVIDPHRAPDGSPDGIAAALQYAADRLGRTTVAEVARRFQRVLTVAGGDPDGPVGDIDLLSRADLDRLLVVWNDTRYPVAPELLLDGYRRTVAIRPDTVAVADAESELTYQEFDARVNRLARRLIDAGVGAETVVGIAVRRSPDLVVAIYAVLTAGGAYLPLDPRDPAHWTGQVLATARPALVLADPATESRSVAALRASGQPAPVLVLAAAEIARYSADPVRAEELLRPVRPGNAACVLPVSAAPRGPELAVLSHSAVNNQISLMLAQYPLGFTDIYLQRNAATSDISLWGFFLPLRAGAQLVLAGTADAGQVAEAIARHGVTVTDFGPAELADFAGLADPARLGSLREIFVTGEPLSPDTVSALRARCGARVHNLYGTAETTVSATSWPAAGSAERSVPIGLPQWNIRVYVLDSRLRPVPPGVPGELYIAGDQLARGYAERPASTGNRFVANPFGYGARMYRTGDLVLWRDATATTPQRLDLLGRVDDQLRFRGGRIHPGTIAAALRSLPDIADAAVLPRGTGAGPDTAVPGNRLVAYVVPAGAEPELVEVRAGVARLLPVSQVPAAFHVVAAIPLDADGTPDRTALPAPDSVPRLEPALDPDDLAGDHADVAVPEIGATTLGGAGDRGSAAGPGDTGHPGPAAVPGDAGHPSSAAARGEAGDRSSAAALDSAAGRTAADPLGGAGGPGLSEAAGTAGDQLEEFEAAGTAGDRLGQFETAGTAGGRPEESVPSGTAGARHEMGGAPATGEEFVPEVSEPAPPGTGTSSRTAAGDNGTAGAAEVSGELPATPTAIRLLGNPLPGIEVRSIVLDLPADQPLEHTEEVVRSLVVRHPLLSARLDSSDRTPTLWIPPREQRGDRQYWWLGPETGEHAVATDDVVQAAADALDPATGRNIHFVVTGAGPARRLVVVANGLVVDDRSWRVIVDELLAGEAAAVVSESRVSQLVQALDQRARSIDLLDEAGWWRRNLAGARTAAPLGTVDLRPRRRVSLAITAEGTAAVTAAADAYDVTVPEVLLTAVAIALRTGEDGAVARALGSLVRCDADARTMVGRAESLVGGFATEFPLSVRIADIDTADALIGGPAAGVALAQIRDLVRSVPGGGAGYALLRYLNTETTAEFAAADSGLFTLRYRDLRPARVHTDGPADGVPLVLTVDVTDEGLLCRFDYATEVFVGDDVKTFAEHWVRALGGLAEHGLRAGVAPALASEPVAPAGSAAYAPSLPPDAREQLGAGESSESRAYPDTAGIRERRPADALESPAQPDTYPAPDPLNEAPAPSAPGEIPASASRGGTPAPSSRAADPAPGSPGGTPAPGPLGETPAPGSLGDTPVPGSLGETPGPGYHPQRTPDAETTSLLRPVTDAPPPPNFGLPQRRSRTDADPTGTGSRSQAASNPTSPSVPESVGDSAAEAPALPGPGSTSAPHPSPADSGTSVSSDSGLPQRRPTSAASGAEPAADVLPQRRPGSLGGSHTFDADSGAPALRDSGLPQRRPRLGAETAETGPEVREATDPSVLPQRRPGAGTDSAAESLPQRRPRLGAESGEPGAEDREVTGAGVLPQRRPDPTGGSRPSTADPGVPGREDSGLPLGVESGETDPDGREATASGRGVLPQRRSGSPGDAYSSPDAGASGPDDSGPLPQRRLRSQDGPDSRGPEIVPGRGPAAPGSPGLPQRRPRDDDRPRQSTSFADLGPGLARSDVLHGETLDGDPDPQAGPDTPAAGPVSLPQRRSAAADETAVPEPERAAPQDAAPAVLPQRRPRAAEAYEPQVQDPSAPPLAPLPQRRRADGGRPVAEATAAPEPELATEQPADIAAADPVHEAGADQGSTADPEPTTFLRPVTDVETTAYMSPILDIGARDDDSTLLSLFDEQVARTPAEPAVRQGARLLSYAELDRKSRALSVELIRFGVGAQTPVAVAMRPGIDLVVAVCAVLRAGGAYVPVNPDGPAGELDRILASAAPMCVLSLSDDGVSTGTGIPVVAIDLLYLDLPADPAADPVVAVEDLADIRYHPDTETGVTTTHRQLVERLRRAQRSHPYDADDLVLHAAPTVGDITLWELFRPLHSGAQILMPDHPGRAADLSRSISANKVTVVHVVPSLLDRFLDSVTDGGGRAAHPSLRRLCVDGAALPPGGVERFMTLLPGAELVIWYGHNETGVITVGSVGGRPVTNDRVYLLDERLRPVPPGTAGEMYIGGPQLARGYFGDPGATAAGFVAAAGGGRLYRTGDIVRRRDGVLEYLGRVERTGGSLAVGSRRGGHD
ncbi:AMP-binding protein [Nocardia sp. CA-290969]|uniref:AMP-binding protein n=1 Tax=Nocardia sp. CA-290969 TaxID=3239986 RepID=UPI003D8CC1F9